MMKELESLLGYTFKDKSLLLTALTHTSFANESKDNIESYERLEFLGDAVVEALVSRELFLAFPNLPEGDLTRMRASLVCEQTLAKMALDSKLCDFIRVGKGEEKSGGRFRPSILSDVFEAVCAAIYLDSDFDGVKPWILKNFSPLIPTAQDLIVDHKTRLQEFAQSKGKFVTYREIGETGPDHAKIFSVEVLIENEVFASGSGKSKKEAEQNAAKSALLKL